MTGTVATLRALERGDLEPLGLLPRSSNYTFLARVHEGADETLSLKVIARQLVK